MKQEEDPFLAHWCDIKNPTFFIAPKFCHPSDIYLLFMYKKPKIEVLDGLRGAVANFKFRLLSRWSPALS
jgi:hypothetical protein